MTTSFKDFALSNALQESLSMMNFTEPTPIQAMAIPLALEGRDILGSAQTGTGKTAAFCVPMIDYLMKNTNAHALVMLPTRELAMQVHDVARKMIGLSAKGPQGIKTALLIGGEPIGKQYVQLDRRPRLIVGTPGRINDHLRGNPDLVDRVSFVVLDEADRMLDMGFSGQIDSILSETALERQTLMFSATFPDSIIKFSRQYLNNPERVSVGSQSKPGENIIQENLNIAQEKKYDELKAQIEKREGSIIVFARTQHSADKIAGKLIKDGYTADALHGGLRQRQREKVTAAFRKSDVRVLVATDVAARGLDVPHIEHVINHDLPQVAEDYIHRIGRTARAGNKGHAVSFISPGERHLWREIEKMLNPGEKYESSLRDEGGRKSGGKKFGGGYGKKDGANNFRRGGDGDRKGGFDKKPFARDGGRPDRKKSDWSPANDFDRAERPARDGFKKPYQKREGGDNFAANPDAWKRTNSGERKEGGFKKSFGGDRPRKDFGDRPKRSFDQTRPDGNTGEGRSFKPRSEGNFDRPRSATGDRPFRKEGEFKSRDDRGNRSEGGFKKPYNKDGAKRAEGRFEKREGGFKKPFSKDGGFKKQGGNNNAGPRSGAQKRITQKKNVRHA